MTQRFLSLCGVAAPVLFVFVTILGGALRPGYSHVSDTISELFSPGSPNKGLLDPLHAAFALLLVLFGIGVLQFVRANEGPRRIGIAGASLLIASGLLSVTIATVFPQDAWGSTPTFPGEMHKILSGILSLLSLVGMVLMGTWFHRAGLFPGFRTYTVVSVAVVIVTAGLFMASVDGPLMGLAERITGLAGLQWTFVLALWILSHADKHPPMA
jgi:hypothetical membrane protein